MKKSIFLFVIIFQALFSQDHWETAVFANDIWRYIVPNSEPSANWKDQSFDDSNWNEGEGGFGYGEVKKALVESANHFFANARARRAELEADPERVQEILREGAARARVQARTVLARAKQACGLSVVPEISSSDGGL